MGLGGGWGGVLGLRLDGARGLDGASAVLPAFLPATLSVVLFNLLHIFHRGGAFIFTTDIRNDCLFGCSCWSE